MAFKLDGKTLPVDVAFTSKGINYPANWLRLSTQQQRDKVPGGAITWERD